VSRASSTSIAFRFPDPLGGGLAVHLSREYSLQRSGFWQPVRFNEIVDALRRRTMVSEPILRQPLLLIRGAKSVVLTEAIAIRMKEILPHMDYVTFADCGHVPSLMNEEQIKNISAWLASTPTS
jgi:pimeloyl-ACP methyl ester carboxylesterase